MSKMLAIAQAVVADAVRRKVVWVVLLFAAVLALVIPVLPSYGVGVVSAVFREVAVSLMFSAAFIVALALSAMRIPSEIERRTVFNVLTRDIRRWHYVVGSWLGMFAVVGLSVLAFTAVTLVVGGYVYSEFMVRLLQAALAVWLEMGVIMAFTVMMSTRFGAVTSIVGALAFTFIGHSARGLIEGSSEFIRASYLPTLDMFNVINPVAHGSGYGLVYGSAMVAAFAGWSGLLLLVGSALFKERDL